MKKTRIEAIETNETNETNGRNGKSDWKKQLVSGGVYIALAVTVVAVTVSTIATTFSGRDAAEGKKNAVTLDGGSRGDTAQSPQTSDSPKPLPSEEKKSSRTDEKTNPSDFTLDTPVSDTAQGVEATVTHKKEQIGEPPSAKDETNREPVTDTPEESIQNEPDKSKPVSEEPADVILPIGYDGYLKPCAGYISKDFSVDVPVYSATMYDYRTHAGVDLACDPGSAVKTAAGGSIEKIYTDDMYGVTVVIAHADGLESVYCGLSPALPVETYVGREVLAGEVIAGVGDTALCESAEVSHLHFELRRDGTAVDPHEYIEF